MRSIQSTTLRKINNELDEGGINMHEYYDKLNSIISSDKNLIGIQNIAKSDPTILLLLLDFFSSVDNYSILNLEPIINEHARNDIAFMLGQCTCSQYNWPELVCSYDKLAGTTSKCRCCPFCRQRCKYDFLKEHSM